MSIYVVSQSQDYEPDVFGGYFSTREKAEAFILIDNKGRDWPWKPEDIYEIDNDDLDHQLPSDWQEQARKYRENPEPIYNPESSVIFQYPGDKPHKKFMEEVTIKIAKHLNQRSINFFDQVTEASKENTK